MVSGFFRRCPLAAPLCLGGEGESGGRVVDDDAPSSPSDREEGAGDVSRMVGRGSRCSSCFDMIFCEIRAAGKGVNLGPGGIIYSCTVDRMAVVISSREVYGKQMFSTFLVLSA